MVLLSSPSSSRELARQLKQRLLLDGLCEAPGALLGRSWDAPGALLGRSWGALEAGNAQYKAAYAPICRTCHFTKFDIEKKAPVPLGKIDKISFKARYARFSASRADFLWGSGLH